jgi:hypothetical protein
MNKYAKLYVDSLTEKLSIFGKEPPHYKGNTMNKSVVGAGVAPATPALSVPVPSVLSGTNDLKNSDIVGKALPISPAKPLSINTKTIDSPLGSENLAIDPVEATQPQEAANDDFIKMVMFGNTKSDLNLAKSSRNREKADYIRKTYRPGMRATDFYKDPGYLKIM